MKSKTIAKRKRGFFAMLTAIIMAVANLSAAAGAYELRFISYNPAKNEVTARVIAEDDDLPLEQQNLLRTFQVTMNNEEPASCTHGGLLGYSSGSIAAFNVIDDGNVEEVAPFDSGYIVAPALGHYWDEGVVTVSPTATTNGVMTFTCKRCEETKTERIPPLGAEVDVPQKPDYGTMTAFYRVTVNHYQQNIDGSYPDKPVETKVLYVAESTVVSPDVNEYEGFTSPQKQSVTANAAAIVDYKYERASSTITFDTDGGSEIEPITQLFGTPVTAPEDPTKDGAAFGGWTPEIPETMPAGDITVTAEWKGSDDADDESDGQGEDGETDGQDEDGDSIGYLIEVAECEYSDEEFALIAAEAEKYGLEAEKIFCWDIKLYRTVNGVKEEQLHETDVPVEVTIELTEEQAERLASYSEFSIVRIHEGKLEVIECEFNKENRTLVFKSDRFSAYALIHDKSLISDEEDDVSDNPSTGVTFTEITVLTLCGAAVLASRKRKSRA